MRTLILLSFVFASSFATASPFVCFTSPLQQATYEFQENELPIVLASWPTCRAMNNTAVGLNAVSIALAAGGIYMACTGVGVPATVVVEGAAVGAQVLSLVVGQLPCDNSADEKRIEEAAKKVVCEELANAGIPCVRGI